MTSDSKIPFCIRVRPSDIADAERILAVQEGCDLQTYLEQLVVKLARTPFVEGGAIKFSVGRGHTIVLSPEEIVKLRTDFPSLIPLMRELKRLYPLCLRDAKKIAERIMSS